MFESGPRVQQCMRGFLLLLQTTTDAPILTGFHGLHTTPVLTFLRVFVHLDSKNRQQLRCVAPDMPIFTTVTKLASL